MELILLKSLVFANALACSMGEPKTKWGKIVKKIVNILALNWGEATNKHA